MNTELSATFSDAERHKGRLLKVEKRVDHILYEWKGGDVK